MSTQRVTAIPFRGLADCFSPSGIPLVEKSPGAPTTSVLVRGRAGTGKSTLALAVAHAIAEASSGIVLYLITEASFSDVEFKAELVGLASQVVSLEKAIAGEPGKVAVCHLVLEHPQSANVESTGELSKDALEFALALLDRHQSLQVRALVIDSLPVPEGRQEGKRLGRNELVGFLQTVEDMGVSPVLIEETDTGTSEQMTFPVDLVFELSMAPNPDTGGLVRQLVVSKCRYSDCSPGPHDAVLEDGAPAIWPFAVNVDIRPQQPLGFFTPIAHGNNRTRVLAINRSGLILSLYDKEQQRVIRAWNQTPGLRQVAVQCGPVTVVASANGSRKIPTSHGPSALTRVVQETTQSVNANAVIFTRLEYLLTKPRFSLVLPELLTRLVQAGLMTMVHGASSGLGSIDDIADFTGQGGHYVTSDVTMPLARDVRCASAWRVLLPDVDRPERQKGVPDLSPYVAALRDAEAKIHSGELSAARDILQKDMPSTNDPTSLRLRIEGAWLLHRLGMTRTGLAAVQHATSDAPAALAALGWTLAEVGDYENACRVALQAIDMDAVHPESLRLWRALRARFTTLAFQPELTPLGMRFWVEAAASRGKLDASDAFLKFALQNGGLPNAFERFAADARMASPSTEHWQDAKVRYEALLGDDALPALDRADILFNLAVIDDRAGEREAAIDKLLRAVEVNPLHEPARDRLESFGVASPQVG